jgi:uncharacterized repeat protein (TIGR03803 family)
MRSKKTLLELIAVLPIVATTLVMTALPAVAQTEKVLHSFNSSDGSSPNAGLIFDTAGNLYGTTYYGGHTECICGTVFELSPAGGGRWTEKVLYSFKHGDDGFGPAAALALDTAGNLYGTAAGGGHDSAGLVFELEPGIDGSWAEKVLHRFGLAGAPLGGLIRDAAGNLYGPGGAGGVGIVFELTLGIDGSWTEKVLHDFKANGTDGYIPRGDLLFGPSGNLYGTTEDGGANGYGTVYELKPRADGSWAEEVLHSFANDGTDGYYPTANLILDHEGNLYGITTGILPFGGVVFELTRGADGVWTESILHSFAKNGVDGYAPLGGVIFDRAGDLYGTTTRGGANDSGTAFELTPGSGGVWTETILYNFDGGLTGGPYAAMIFDAHGNLYGTTLGGGVNNDGTVFEIKP